MLEVGQIFKKNACEYCLMDIIDYDDKKYALFSVESNKFSFVFYEIIENEFDYNFKPIEDEKLNFILLELYEKGVEE